MRSCWHGSRRSARTHAAAQLRALLLATYEIQAQIAQRRDQAPELIDQAERLIWALRARDNASQQRLLELAVSDELDRLERASRDERAVPGLSTGIAELDRMLGPLQNGRLYVVAARPAMGKSLRALQLARHAASVEATRVLFASLEMSDSETAQRHLAALSGVDSERLHRGRVEAEDWTALLQAACVTHGTPMHVPRRERDDVGELRGPPRHPSPVWRDVLRSDQAVTTRGAG
ncbi:MAG: DnaB-like helicase C-terminal domain-containing protein [Solirubrobacteraceae bacterium]